MRLYRKWVFVHIFPRNFLLLASKTVCVTRKSEHQANVKLEADITAGQLTAQLLNTMFPQFSRATIYNKINRFKKIGTHSRQPESGRPKKLLGNDMKSLGKLVEKSIQISAKDFLRYWRAGAELRYGNGPFNEHSRHLATKRKKTKSVPYLRNDQKESRLTFCTRMQDYSWYIVFITDECLFYVHHNTLMHWYRRRRLSIKIPKFSSEVVVWGALSSKGCSIHQGCCRHSSESNSTNFIEFATEPN